MGECEARTCLLYSLNNSIRGKSRNFERRGHPTDLHFKGGVGGHHSDSGVYKRFILKNRSQFFKKWGGEGPQRDNGPTLDKHCVQVKKKGTFTQGFQ